MMQGIVQACLLRSRIASFPASLRRSASVDCSGRTTTTHTADDDDIVHLPDNVAIQIPVYPERPDEALATRKARLLYQSRKRGMLENDLLLSTFAAKYLPGFDADQTQQFDRLINRPSNDWDIFYWATSRKPTPDEYENEIMRMLRQHVVSKDRERRMPDL